MIIKDRFAEALLRRGISQAKLAKEAGLSPAAIQQIANGSTKRSRALPEIANALGVTPDWLEGRSNTPSANAVTEIRQEDGDIVVIPYLDANLRELSSPFAKTRVLRFSRSFMERISGSSTFEDLAMLPVFARSMAPTLMTGDDILVRSRSEIDGDPEGIWVFEFEKRPFLRRLRRNGSNVIVSADNPSAPPFEIPEILIRFQARVIWHSRSLTIP